ncbi:F420-dependent glucose-6-phosphate dehydrogenase 1 [Rhodoplanes serenus]|uniref:F420-dependent glucose-6-phosphate dehydrogenase 1 n=1 Tax=Rhodoplanes serenus TaxID=200615 RepID=A0A447D011_9BRAD|nr:LLM class flavin-dependent oxidoreductase [Rhodoplanes serenus]MBI5113099.1 LLM class flavin-dependent oxidoreductase [Rhodovulum sp.]VCU10872.1 F420-dependent glucose-6-phosphate dehydrogenase 1 [Rhodoplanes serenus]
MSVPFGISFDCFAPIAEMVATARRAEACGATSFWIAEHLGFRESFVTAAVLGTATGRARLVPTSVSPYLRHPTPTAMALASLAEFLPDRLAIAVGVGNPLFLRESGLAIDKPLRAVRDYVAGLRDLLGAEPVTREGHTFRLDGARLAFAPQPTPPVFLAPMGPQMLRLAGTIGDGLVLSAGLSTAFVAGSLAAAAAGAGEAGRAAERLHKTAYVYFIGGGDPADQRLKVRRKLAFLFRNENIRENIRASGLPIDQEAIMAAIARRDGDAALALVPDEAADVFAVMGDRDACRRRLREYLDAGLDEVVLSLVGTPEDRDRSLDVVALL